jgi:hypothetical protein
MVTGESLDRIAPAIRAPGMRQPRVGICHASCVAVAAAQQDDSPQPCRSSFPRQQHHERDTIVTIAPRDRTREFHSTLHSIRQRSTLNAPAAYSLSSDPNAQASQRLLPNGVGNDGSHGAGKKGRSALAGSSEFARMAGQIGKDINATTIKLQKLAQREFKSVICFVWLT